MTVLIVLADGSDDTLRSSNSSYSSALAGSNLTTLADSTLSVGQNGGSGTYFIRQSFLQYDFTPLADSTVVTGAFWLRGVSTSGSSVSRRLELFRYDWGASVDSSDWRDSDWLQDGTQDPSIWIAIGNNIHKAGSGYQTRLGIEDIDYLDAAGNKRIVMGSSRNRGELAPSSEEYNFFYATEETGTDRDPRLEAGFTTDSALDKILGAQAQLSDGTYVYLEQDNTALASTGLDVVYNDNTTATVIDTITIDQELRGAQSCALTRDGSDNIYVFLPSATDSNRVTVYSYEKTGAETWTGPNLRHPLFLSDQGVINNIAAAWHDVGPGLGTIVCLIQHNASRGGAESTLDLLDCNLLHDPPGTDVVRKRLQSGSSEAGILSTPSVLGYDNFINDTGTLLDIAAEPGHGAVGYVISAERDAALGKHHGLSSIGRYVLNNNGDNFSTTHSRSQDNHIVKDPDAKSRVLPLGSDLFAVITVCDEGDRGLQIQVLTSSSELLSASLHTDGPASLPSASDMSNSSAWDAVYDDVENNIWVFYFDDADNRRLLRTHLDLDTGLLAADEFEVNNTVGASGSTNHAIRLARGNRETKDVLVSVANEDSSGNHSLIVLNTVINSLPEQPTLTPSDNFDAANAHTFEWAFNDPDPGDSQSAYQLQIEQVGGGTVVDTGKVVSTNESHEVSGGSLTNGEDHLWRVKTWDQDDFEGPYSDYSGFTTGDTGVVNIIDPSIDNDPNVITSDYTIEWELTGATQDDYRVVVVRTDNGDELLNTDWVTSSDTTFLVTGMETATEYEVQVTTREAGVESNTATRLITPDYTFPEKPVIAASVGDVYILVEVSNPEPQGDRPHPDVNQVWRRQNGSGDQFRLIAEIDPNSSYRDYEARSDTVYDYFVRAGVEESE